MAFPPKFTAKSTMPGMDEEEMPMAPPFGKKKTSPFPPKAAKKVVKKVAKKKKKC